MIREPSGWQITAKGREFLNSLEGPLARCSHLSRFQRPSFPTGPTFPPMSLDWSFIRLKAVVPLRPENFGDPLATLGSRDDWRIGPKNARANLSGLRP